MRCKAKGKLEVNVIVNQGTCFADGQVNQGTCFADDKVKANDKQETPLSDDGVNDIDDGDTYISIFSEGMKSLVGVTRLALSQPNKEINPAHNVDVDVAGEVMLV